MSRRRERRRRAEALDLPAYVNPADGERVHVLDARGASSSPWRRRDNLLALVKVIGAERVSALCALRAATLVAGRGVAPRSCLSTGGAGGGDWAAAFLGMIDGREKASAVAGGMWGAVGMDPRGTVLAVVVNGWSIEALAKARGGRIEPERAAIRAELAAAGDAVTGWLDRAYGGSGRLRATR